MLIPISSPMLSGGFAKISFKPLNQGSNNKKNQSWKVPIKQEQSEARFDSAEHKELRLRAKVPIKREQSEARFDSAEHEELRLKVKVLLEPETG